MNPKITGHDLNKHLLDNQHYNEKKSKELNHKDVLSKKNVEYFSENLSDIKLKEKDLEFIGPLKCVRIIYELGLKNIVPDNAKSIDRLISNINKMIDFIHRKLPANYSQNLTRRFKAYRINLHKHLNALQQIGVDIEQEAQQIQRLLYQMKEKKMREKIEGLQEINRVTPLYLLYAYKGLGIHTRPLFQVCKNINCSRWEKV